MLSKCYARSIGNCSNQLSKEHYISKGVLELIGCKIEVSGFSWLKGKKNQLTIPSLTSKILCTQHNSELSILDDSEVTANLCSTHSITANTGILNLMG
jgi:hypothetical protein